MRDGALLATRGVVIRFIGDDQLARCERFIVEVLPALRVREAT
jgi:hypothetical protein